MKPFVLNSGSRQRTFALRLALWATTTLGAAAACTDSNVPDFTAPTSVPNSPTGIQNAVGGLFASLRNDIGSTEYGFLFLMEDYARDGAPFLNTNPLTISYPLGLNVTPASEGAVWPQEFQNISQAVQVIGTIPNVVPTYSTQQAASLVGVVQTIEAYNYMMVLEAHDTLGASILSVPIAASPPQALCMKDVWQYVVALLDSANASLTSAGTVAPPIKVPPGFAGVSLSSGPSTAVGSFASFNRALAAKANLELAYAVARSDGGNAPTPSTPGSPAPAALAAAAADIAASGMYNPTVLAPNVVGGFTPGPYAVTLDFSAISGDLSNPVNANLGILAQLNDFIADVDTASDLRWKTKFVVNANPVQEPQYNVVASPFQYGMYPTPGSPIPLVREEQLVLWNAQIQMGLGNYVQALSLVNQVRTAVGGLPAFPLSVASSYTSIRDSLMKEQRISTTYELSVDRTIAIRMYGLAAVADTTWGTAGHPNEDPHVTTGDYHTTINPIPTAELQGRGGTWSTVCH
jgi:hypothetical protein